MCLMMNDNDVDDSNHDHDHGTGQWMIMTFIEHLLDTIPCPAATGSTSAPREAARVEAWSRTKPGNTWEKWQI
jgi:hypothetical protein